MGLSVHIRKQMGAFRLSVDLDAPEGVTGLLGASGSGKSVTLKCIAGILRPDEGIIVLDGTILFDAERGIDLPPQQRRVGYLFQNYALFPTMTVGQNILCGLPRERDSRRRRQELERMLRLFQLEHLEHARPAQLSGGEAQRTALARMLVNRPQLLLLDEPFGALDSHLKGRLQMELKQLLADYGRDALLVTHSRDEAYHLCNAIGVMEAGRLLTCKDTKALFAQPDSIPAARLTGCKNIAPARKTGEHEIEIPSWGIRLTTAQPVKDDLIAAGVRAHAFSPLSQTNRQAVSYCGLMEEPFAWILTFRFPAQSRDSQPLWRRLPKEGEEAPMPGVLGVEPEDVLLLYP